MKKALVYNPYLDGMGGGERYTCSLIKFLLNENWQVDIPWDDALIIEEIKERFQIDLYKAKIVDNAFTRLTHVLERILMTREYDLCFFLSDGSIPLAFAKKNILHFQVPFTDIKLSRFDKWKLSKFQHIVCNSQFTKKIIDKTYGVNSKVIYPPVSLIPRNNKNKENIILSVGRFHPNKKQMILLEAFKTMANKDWKLILAGGVMPADGEYLFSLQQEARGHNIEFFTGIPYQELISLYAKAKIYWHATGFGESKPENLEHFGISTVEAMSAGCAPIVYNAGGQKEIINHGENGFLWDTEKDLIKITTDITGDERLREKIIANAIKRSQDFSTEKFYQQCAIYY